MSDSMESNKVNKLILEKLNRYDSDTQEICKLAIELSTQYSELAVVEQIDSAIRKLSKREDI